MKISWFNLCAGIFSFIGLSFALLLNGADDLFSLILIFLCGILGIVNFYFAFKGEKEQKVNSFNQKICSQCGKPLFFDEETRKWYHEGEPKLQYKHTGGKKKK